MTRTRRPLLGIAVALAGLACLVLGAWTLAQLRLALASGPLLLSPFGTAVLSDGSVLVGVGAARIHVYDREGRFLRSWPVPEAVDRFRLRVTAADRVEVATDTGLRIDYDREGNVAPRDRDPQAFAAFGSAHDFEASGPSGERYSIATGGLVRVSPEPPALLVPAVRPPLAWFADALLVVPLLVGVGAVAIFAGLALTSRAGAAR